jgi:hypothetical protein
MTLANPPSERKDAEQESDPRLLPQGVHEAVLGHHHVAGGEPADDPDRALVPRVTAGTHEHGEEEGDDEVIAN